MTTHELKCWPEFFEAVVDGRKRFEIRRDDRGFKVGDVLHLREFKLDSGVGASVEFGTYTGRATRMTVTFTLREVFGLYPGHVAMGLEPACWDCAVENGENCLGDGTVRCHNDDCCGEAHWCQACRKFYAEDRSAAGATT